MIRPLFITQSQWCLPYGSPSDNWIAVLVNVTCSPLVCNWCPVLWLVPCLVMVIGSPFVTGCLVCVLQEGFAPPEDEFEEQEEYWDWAVWLSKLFTWSSPRNKVVNNPFCHWHFLRYMPHPHPQAKLACAASPVFFLFLLELVSTQHDEHEISASRRRWLFCVKMWIIICSAQELTGWFLVWTSGSGPCPALSIICAGCSCN